VDPILIERIERLSDRFTGVRITVKVLDEPPIFLIRRRVEDHLDDMRLNLRFRKKEPISERIFWMAQTLFLESAFKANLNRMEQFEDPHLYKSDAILAGAFLAEYACVIGTEWESDVHAKLIQRENEAKYERQAGALMLKAGAFGLAPFDTALAEAVGETISIADARIHERMSRVLDEIAIAQNI
jgi:hypothetical protein